MLSNLLYERRFGPYFVEPVVAGIDPVDNKPFVGGMDLIGSPSECDFIVSGSCTEQLYGMCETLVEKDMVSSRITGMFSISKVVRNSACIVFFLMSYYHFRVLNRIIHVFNMVFNKSAFMRFKANFLYYPFGNFKIGTFIRIVRGVRFLVAFNFDFTNFSL